jgi:hypothetical protein
MILMGTILNLKKVWGLSKSKILKNEKFLKIYIFDIKLYLKQ